MITATVADLFNDLFFEILRLVIIVCFAGLAIFLGIKLRKNHDAKINKAVENKESEESDNTNTTSEQ